MTLHEAQARISSREYAEWMAFYIWEAEQADPNKPPSDEALAGKMAAFAEAFKNREG
jgi:hypothetical protein